MDGSDTWHEGLDREDLIKVADHLALVISTAGFEAEERARQLLWQCAAISRPGSTTTILSPTAIAALKCLGERITRLVPAPMVAGRICRAAGESDAQWRARVREFLEQ